MTMMHFYSLQDSSSLSMSNISFFYDHVMVILSMIISMVLYVSLLIFFWPILERHKKGSELLEGFWTIIPCFILGSLAMPSLVTLYLSDEMSSVDLTVKITGHQWYWSYQIENMETFDSYFINTIDLNTGYFRLLEVDNSLSIPYNSSIRLLISSDDVLHSWAIPSMGVKMDAVPGRLNQTFIFPLKMGLFYGQCSEICGSMHSFMPICVEVL